MNIDLKIPKSSEICGKEVEKESEKTSVTKRFTFQANNQCFDSFKVNNKH